MMRYNGSRSAREQHRPRFMVDSETFRFGPFCLVPGERELLSKGTPVRLGARAFDVLLALVQQRGRVVTKDQLMAEVWPRRVVEENNLQAQISALRKILARDAAGLGDYLQTVPGRGYRFCGKVEHEHPGQARIDPATSIGAGAPVLLSPDRPSIAVLPFTNVGGDQEQEYFADGIAEDVITLLSKSRGLFVIARNSSFTYKARAIDIRIVGRELGVRYLLEGSVRKAGNRVRVSAQLIEADTNAHLWAEHYDRDLTDIFAVQDEITARVSTAILPTMQRSERERATRKPPDSLDAWECYQRGLWHFSKLEADEIDRARKFFERAVVLDPNFAIAEGVLALTYAIEAAVFRPFAEKQVVVPHAVKHARRSVALDPTESVGHGALAHALHMLGRHNEAIAEADLAVTLDPNSAWAHLHQGFVYTWGGRPRDGIVPLRIAIRLSPFDPLMPMFLHGLSRALYLSGDYSGAISAGTQLCQSYPNHGPGHRTLIAALGQAGQMDTAQRTMAEALGRFGDDFRSRYAGFSDPETRRDDHEHLTDGWRKGRVFER
jgi:adenylate cyclase